MDVNTTIKRFEKLREDILAHAGSTQSNSIGFASSWRDDARSAIREVFGDIDVGKELEEALDRITFSAGGIMGTGNGPLIYPTDEDSDKAFRDGVQKAGELMDRCIDEIKKLNRRFGGSIVKMIAVCLTFLTSLIASATTLYVDGTNGSDSYSGKSQSLAKKTIQAAIDVASNGDVISVVSGTYSSIDTKKKILTIKSESGPMSTIIDAKGTSRCAILGARDYTRNAILIGFTLQNGKDSADGDYSDGAAVCSGTIVDCIIKNCTAVRSIIFANTASNCLVYANNATSGYAVFMHNEAFNCTVVDNTGYAMWDGYMRNCIAFGEIYKSSGKSEGCHYCCLDTARAPEEGNFVADPLFVDAENGDYHLSSESPCVDSGDNSCVAGEQDLDGKSRIVNSIVDIGCYEYQYAPSILYVNGAIGSDDNTGLNQSSPKKTIQAAIDIANDGDTIRVAEGTYAPIDTKKKVLTIWSQKGAHKTIIDAKGVSRCAVLGVRDYTRNATLIGFTLQNGKDSATGDYTDGAAVCSGTITDCIIRNCTAIRSIIFANTASNCLVYANNAASGYAVFMHNEAFNCTVVDNTGYAMWDGYMRNCIVSGEIYISSGKPDGCHYCCLDSARTPEQGNFVADPLFADDKNGDYRLSAGSPCIDTGDNSYAAGDTDLDGNARIVNGVVDIGCYEYAGGDEPILRTVTFDANGGTCATDSVKVSDRAAVGELPTATRSNYDFLGWFTAAVGGEQVSSETVVTNDVTWYAQWMATYTVIVGAKASVDVGLKGQGYSTKTLPKGLTYSDKTGLVTGTCKTATAAEGVEVTFTKKNAEDVVVNFVVRKENEPTVECASLTNGAFVVGVAGGGRGATALPIAIDAESGIKNVTATKLPTGMKIASSKDKTSWYITGAPTKAGTYDVAITLTTAAGNKVTEKFSVTVAALPSGATGTFNGFVQKTGAGEGETLNAGSFQATVSDVGKITAKVVVAAGTYSFTATGWDSANEGVYSVKMTTKKGDVLTLACDSTAAWNTRQLTGTFTAVGGATALPGGDSATTYAVEAQKNAFGKQWFFNATGDDANGWTLSFAENAKSAALTVTLNADGKTSVAGKLGAYKITASGYVDVSGIGTGAIFADFAPIVTVGKAKKVLSLRANLWFDKKNDHEQGVGSAVFVQ